MRNVNLNILKFLHSINKFYLSLSNIGLEVSYQLSVISSLRKLPSPHLPISPLKKLQRSIARIDGRGFGLG
ncbi:MAG: hypothetical protein ACKO1I_06265 [Microcystis aeruginosa]